MKLVFVMVGFTFFSPSMIAGGKLALGLDATSFILAVVIGNLFLAAYTGSLAYISQKTGLNLDLLAQRAFGRRGSYLPSALISLTQMGWFGVGVAMLSLPLAQMAHPGLILGLPNGVVFTLVIGVLMSVTAALGIRALAVFGTIAVPLILVLGIYSNVLSVAKLGGLSGLMGAGGTGTAVTMSLALTMVIGNFVSGGTATPNFARFGRTAKQSVAATVLAFLVGNIIMFVFGAIGAAAYGEADIFNVLIIQGLTIPAFITLGLNIWSTNNNALYTSGLGFTHILRTPVRWTTFGAGVVGTVFALFLYNNFVGYLSLLGSMIPPVGIILILHFALNRRSFIAEAHAASCGSRGLCADWLALVALVGGVIFGLLVQAGITPLNSLIAATVIYLVGHFATGRNKH